MQHYKNLPMQYTENFSAVIIENFVGEIWIFLIFELKTYIVGTQMPRRGSSIDMFYLDQK